MADHRSSLTYDLSPSVTSALGAAYDDMLQSLDYEGTEFLRYALACDLMKAAFAGERDPHRLRERAITFVRKCLHPPRLAEYVVVGAVALVPDDSPD
jgi:hypothetical protein